MKNQRLSTLFLSLVAAVIALTGFPSRAFAGCHLVFQGIGSHFECDNDPCGGTGCTVFDDPVTNYHAISLAWNSHGAWALYEGTDIAQAQHNALIHCAGCSIATSFDASAFVCISVAQKGSTPQLWESHWNN